MILLFGRIEKLDFAYSTPLPLNLEEQGGFVRLTYAKKKTGLLCEIQSSLFVHALYTFYQNVYKACTSVFFNTLKSGVM